MNTAGTGGSSAQVKSCPAGPYGKPTLTGLTPRRLAGVPPLDDFNDQGNTFTNVEGPVWIAGTLYVSEFALTPAPSSRVLAISDEGSQVTVALSNVGSNGLAVDAQGRLIATDHGSGALVLYAFPLASATPLVSQYMGQRFNSPNDLAVRSDGQIYFSDPDYQSPKPRPQSQTRVYHWNPATDEIRVVDATRAQPNGVTLSPDERALYVAGADGLEAYAVASDGSIVEGSGTRMSGLSGGADGLAVDCAGNVYAASGNRVVVLSAQGDELGSIELPQVQSATNVAFGGQDSKTLFVTAMGDGEQRGVFTVELDVPGLPY